MAKKTKKVKKNKKTTKAAPKKELTEEEKAREYFGNKDKDTEFT